ncbi:hypothetical protein EG329_009055 [Mollisiaceae sp. DMI_Dod_QoI]|nr:hypothetical protein EG329_009055 [Helotiales sp. DMI_Dod_QoI]
MSTSEMKQLVEEGGFLSKVKGLRQTPVKKWEGDTWNGLDEILRVVKDHGPVDFRRIYSEVDLKIKDSYYSSASGVPIVKSIRNEILSYISRSMCFETKYNAMNALADIGILLMKRSVCYDDQKVTFDTLFGALSIVGQMFNEEEVAQILTEMQSENFMSAPGFLSKFLSDMYGGYSDYIKVYSNREMLKSAVDRYMSQKTSAYGQRGLLVKILYLRFYETSRFEGANDILDEVIALFPDRSTPLQPQHILRQLDKEIFDYLQLASYGHWIPPEPGAARRIRKNIDRSISQVSKQASRGTRVEVKLSALKILTEIGLRMVEWCHSTHPQWHRTIFQDHLSEDSLTDSMLLICHSLNKSDWIKVMEDQSFLDDMRELDARRLEIPESMEGLDPILSIIRDPEHETSKSSRRTIAAAPVAIENIIDLTDD